MTWKDDSRFVAAVQVVLDHEGGYSDNPDDSGNWTGGEVGRGTLKGTNFGISAASYPNLNISALTKDDASAIYYTDWWERYKYVSLGDAIAPKVFDLAVNNPASAHRALQRGIRAASAGLVRIADDGIIGEQTITAANACDPGALLAAIRSEYAGYCRAVGAHYVAVHGRPDPFLNGWLNRAYE